METTNNGNPDEVLRQWRNRVLNGFFVISALISLPALVAILLNVSSVPGTWKFALSFSLIEFFLILLAVWRSLPFGIRVGGLGLIGYAAAILNLKNTGLGGVGSLYLLVIPILILILMGKRAGFLAAVCSALLGTLFAFLLHWNLLSLNLVLRTPWTSLTAVLMFLTMTMTLLLLFYRFQERLIAREHQSQAELLRAQTLLEEQNASLEQKVEERTGELQASNLSLEQRNAELAIINSVQEGLASKLDMQAIYELVGEKIRETFHAQIVSIVTYDRATQWMESRYYFEAGQVMPGVGFPSFGFRKYVVESRQVLVINEDMDRWIKQYDNPIRLGAQAKSAIFLPMLVGEEAMGVISLQNVDRENAFSASDRRLLETLASSMSIALENARLFDETQQRNTELAIINSVQEGLASKLDLQAICELIGEKVREVFHVQVIDFVTYDPETNLISMPYSYERGDRSVMSPREPYGFRQHVIHSGAPFLINRNFKELAARYNNPLITGEWPKSALFVPLLIGNRVKGVISIQDLGRENAFSDSDVRLLQTLANAMSIALENAQLFEAEQRAYEQAEILRSIAQALNRSLSLTDVFNLVLTEIQKVIPYDSAGIYQVHENRRKFVTGLGFPNLEELIGISFEFNQQDDEIGYLISRSQQPLILDDASATYPQYFNTGSHAAAKIRSYMAVPILLNEALIGLITLDKHEPGFYKDEHARLAMAFAAQAATAIHNARLFDEIKCQQQCAQEAQRRLADIIDFLPDATLVIDNDGNVIAWNRAMEEMTGIATEEMLGKGSYEYAIPFYGERRPILIDLVQRSREDIEKTYAHIQWSGKILTGEAYTPSLKGAAHHLYAAASALHDPQGNIVGAIETIRDVTERKHTEEELKKAKAAAEQANQAKSAFLATMSHEIRTPMNAVIGMSSLLLDTPLNAEQRDYAETIRNSGDALLAVINDILDFSKIEAGRMDLEHQPFDLRECIESALDLVAGRAVEKNLDLAYVLEDEVPTGLCGDVTRLRQILLNLFGNAVKFTEKGEVVLTVEKSSKKDELLFSVRDTGVGIPPDRINTLFQSFSQADSSTTRRYGGTGLGLAISRRLVEMMGGNIQVQSEGIPGKGSTFSFTILAEPADVPNRIPHKDANGRKATLQGKRLLIVDDNATNRRILRLQTQKWGMAPCDTASPKQALRWLKAGEHFDLAILDMYMPEMDGQELAQAIRGLPNGKDLPLMMLSSLARRETHLDNQNFIAQLHKPLKPSQLFDALVNIFVTPVPEEKIQPAMPGSQFDPQMGKRHPLRILLAEDNLVNQKVALRILEQSGYRADIASNGKETLESVDRQVYDVILMDVQMPEMDGLEATRQILTRWPERKDRPCIIAMTADAMQSDRENCLAAGMDDYVAKPIRVAELMEALQKVQARKSLHSV